MDIGDSEEDKDGAKDELIDPGHQGEADSCHELLVPHVFYLVLCLGDTVAELRQEHPQHSGPGGI